MLFRFLLWYSLLLANGCFFLDFISFQIENLECFTATTPEWVVDSGKDFLDISNGTEKVVVEYKCNGELATFRSIGKSGLYFFGYIAPEIEALTNKMFSDDVYLINYDQFLKLLMKSNEADDFIYIVQAMGFFHIEDAIEFKRRVYESGLLESDKSEEFTKVRKELALVKSDNVQELSELRKNYELLNENASKFLWTKFALLERDFIENWMDPNKQCEYHPNDDEYDEESPVTPFTTFNDNSRLLLMIEFLNNSGSLFITEYSLILVYFLISILLSYVILGFSYKLVVQKPETEKTSGYECGFESYEDARQKFNVRFYLLAILFILFDIEAMFLIPWCVTLSFINYIGYLVMMEFILELFLGFLYVWYIGGLDWE